MYRRIYSFVLVILVTVLVLGGCQKATQKKPVPQNQPKPKATASIKTLQELAAKDPYDNGCVSCHKKEGDVDRSLPAYVKRIPGHPEVRESTVNACYNCHEAQKNYEWYKAFYRGIHKTHWKSETFYAKLKGQCYSCHTVESNGVAGIKNYPPAGFRTSIGGTAKPNTQQPSSGKATGQEATQSTEKPKQTEESQKQTTPGTKGATPGEEIPTPTP